MSAPPPTSLPYRDACPKPRTVAQDAAAVAAPPVDPKTPYSPPHACCNATHTYAALCTPTWPHTPAALMLVRTPATKVQPQPLHMGPTTNLQAQWTCAGLYHPPTTTTIGRNHHEPVHSEPYAPQMPQQCHEHGPQCTTQVESSTPQPTHCSTPAPSSPSSFATPLQAPSKSVPPPPKTTSTTSPSPSPHTSSPSPSQRSQTTLPQRIGPICLKCLFSAAVMLSNACSSPKPPTPQRPGTRELFLLDKVTVGHPPTSPEMLDILGSTLHSVLTPLGERLRNTKVVPVT
ncbi:hypothetical protein K439DRAFT_1662285 [Ramaria rubella]|nr:hypothetical protein K439DRAFT_1662285 [Ramaria rubella]